MSLTRLALLWGALTVLVLTTGLELWSPTLLIAKLAPALCVVGLLSLTLYGLARQDAAQRGVQLPLLLWTGLAAGLGLRLLTYVLSLDVPDRLGLDLYAGRVLLEGLNPFAYTAGEALGGGLRVGDAGLERARAMVAGSATLTDWLRPFEAAATPPQTALLALPFLATSQALTPESPLAWFAFLFGVESLTLLILLMLLRRVGRAPGWVLLFWINPVWLIHAFAPGSAFVLIAPLMTLLIWAAVSERSALGGILLAFAAAFSLWLIVLLPLVLRTAGRRPYAWRRAAYGLVGFVLLSASLCGLHLLFGAPLPWFGSQTLGLEAPTLVFAEALGLGRFGLVLWLAAGLILGALAALPPLPDQAQRAVRAGGLGFVMLLLSDQAEPLALAALFALLPLARAPVLVIATGFGLVTALLTSWLGAGLLLFLEEPDFLLWGQSFQQLLGLGVGIVILLWLLSGSLAPFRRNRALE